ncbi:polycomb group RING finger 3, partial [Brachionus plicatilis]
TSKVSHLLSCKIMKSDKKILLTDVNTFITCVLCKGYLIDATTITECLHTFCKKCIVEYLEENTNCPICDTLLHQSHPLLYIAHDRTLQSIVYKLVPDLERAELQRQLKYFDDNQLEYPRELKEKLEQFNLLTDKKLGSINSVKKAESNGEAKTDMNNFHRDDEQIALSLEPLDGLKHLERKFILCSCHSTINHLKKFVAHKIYSNIDLYKELDIVCNDEILGKDHTLKFILVTKWKDKVIEKIFHFFFNFFFQI